MKDYSGIKKSCDTINAYIVHCGGDYKKVFERVELERINDPTSFKGIHEKHIRERRYKDSRGSFKKIRKMD